MFYLIIAWFEFCPTKTNYGQNANVQEQSKTNYKQNPSTQNSPNDKKHMPKDAEPRQSMEPNSEKTHDHKRSLGHFTCHPHGHKMKFTTIFYFKLINYNKN